MEASTHARARRCERGTEVAVYDYADAAERCLGMTAYVLHPGCGSFEGTRCDASTR